MKINIDKLVTDIKRLEDRLIPTEREIARERVLNKVEGAKWSDVWPHPERETHLTKLYSLRAHLRGKLHMKRVHGSTIYDITEKDFWRWFGNRGVASQEDAENMNFKFEWTLEDQERLIEKVLQNYVVPEEEEAA